MYGYPSEQGIDSEEFEDWFLSLEEEYLKNSDIDTMIVGDFNAHTGMDNLPINRNGKLLNNLIKRRDLNIINKEDICTGHITREDPNGTKSVIDYVLANTGMISRITKMMIDDQHKYKISRYIKRNGDHKEIPIDHNIILVEIQSFPKKKADKTTKWDFKNEENLKKFKQLTEKIKFKEQWDTSGNIDKKYNSWMRQIKSMMYQTLNRITLKHQPRYKETRFLIKKKSKLNRLIKKAKTIRKEGVVIKYLENKREILIEEITQKLENETAEKMNKKLDRITNKGDPTNEIWKIRKKNQAKIETMYPVQDKEGEMISEKTAIQDRYIEYYEELLKNRTPHDEYEMHAKTIEEEFKHNLCNKSYEKEKINEPFSMKELDEIIKSLKISKSPGPDEIPYELIINSGSNMKENLLSMYNHFWNEEEIPTELTNVIIKSLYKGKGTTADLQNQRGIFISSIILKIYEKLILNRISPKLELQGFSIYQAGGRPNMSTIDQLFILRTVINHQRYTKSNITMQFMDLKKAFDKMVLKNVLNDLWKANIKGKIWRNVYKINQATRIKIKTPYGETDYTQTGEIVKQGSVLASTLAALHTDGVNEYFLLSGLGINYGKIHIPNLIYQDDIVRIEKTEHNMNRANKIHQVYQHVNRMQFHEEKTVYVSNQSNLHITLNNVTLKQEEAVKYLGDYISADMRYHHTIENRKMSINGIIAELKAITSCATAHMEIRAAIQYHQLIVAPKLIHNSESWSNLSKNEIQELEKVYNQAIKRLIGIPFSTPTIGLLTEIGIPSLEEIIDRRKLMFLYRLENQDESKLTHQVYKEQKVMPERNWATEIEEILIKYQINNNNIKSMKKTEWKREIDTKLNEWRMKTRKEWLKGSKKCNHMIDDNQQRKFYLEELPTTQAKTILMERLNMTKVKDNFHHDNEKPNCPLCQDEEKEDSIHLLKCPLQHHQDLEMIQVLKQTRANVTKASQEQLLS